MWRLEWKKCYVHTTTLKSEFSVWLSRGLPYKHHLSLWVEWHDWTVMFWRNRCEIGLVVHCKSIFYDYATGATSKQLLCMFYVFSWWCSTQTLTAPLSPADRCVHAGTWEILQEVQKKVEELRGNYWASHPEQERFASLSLKSRFLTITEHHTISSSILSLPSNACGVYHFNCYVMFYLDYLPDWSSVYCPSDESSMINYDLDLTSQPNQSHWSCSTPLWSLRMWEAMKTP